MQTIQLTQGKMAMVDDEDFERLTKYKWFAYFHHGTWYAARCTYDPSHGPEMRDKIRITRMHRDILNLVKDDGKITDHIDGNGLNNQKSNLRITNHSGNVKNAKARMGRKYKGVYDRSKWEPTNPLPFAARITYDGHKDVLIGRYKTAEEAALAYNEAAKKYHGEFARLNHITP